MKSAKQHKDVLNTNPKVDFYFAKAGKWQHETEQLRLICLSAGLEEELKWGCPCYLHNDSNIVLIHVFKDYCALLFFKGAIMPDKYKLLVQQTKNVQSARQIRFQHLHQIIEQQQQIEFYIKEAIKVEKSGLKVELKETREFETPDELTQIFKAMPDLKKAFHALTPGRQRAYLLFFSGAKQSATRQARIEKSIEKILRGKGLNDE